MKPSNVPTGRVIGRVIIGVEDGPDPDDEPDYIAAKGSAELQMSVPYLPNPTADPVPVTMLNARRSLVLDSEGYWCTANADGSAGARGMRLEADGSPDALVSGWTWNITYRFDPVNGSAPSIAAHSFVMLPDAVVDLTTVIKVPSSPGYGLPQSEAAVLRAEGAALESAQSAADAEAAALDVVTRANSGEFKGDQGLPGNATMRVDTTAGTRVFITDGVTERMISAETGRRALTPLGDRTGVIRISRTGNLVTVTVIGLVQSAAGTVVQIPEGFRPLDAQYIRTYWNFQASLSFGGNLYMSSTLAGGDYATFTYVTTSEWPTNLPGTPA